MITLALIAEKEHKWKAMAYNIGARDEEIQDAVQNMYLRVAEIEQEKGSLEHLAFIDKKGKNKGVNDMYIFSIIRSIITDGLRKEKNKAKDWIFTKYEQMYVHNPMQSPDVHEYAYEELMDEVKCAINQMHDHDQRLLELYFVYGYSLRELSKNTGVPTHSIFNTLKNAKQIIKSKVNGKFKNYIEEKHSDKTVQRAGR